jgi:hypothetical protein
VFFPWTTLPSIGRAGAGIGQPCRVNELDQESLNQQGWPNDTAEKTVLNSEMNRLTTNGKGLSGCKRASCYNTAMTTDDDFKVLADKLSGLMPNERLVRERPGT